ncbi:MAG: shikimate dehydrogenase [Weeksellaceae bacterium]
MRRFGLIGKNIAYSFSKKYFHQKFENEGIKNTLYQVFDLNSIHKISSVWELDDLEGINVTKPYKEAIIPFLDNLEVVAKKIGAVNCVKISNGEKTGYNTDAYGFENSLKPLLKPHHNKALILGDGGAAKAVKFVLEKLKIPYQTVSRNGSLRYSELNAAHIENHLLIINCTPVGTFPNIDESPEIPYEALTDMHLLYDLIYNPEKTQFLQFGEEKGAEIKNGYEMLVLQAEKSWEIWNSPL